MNASTKPQVFYHAGLGKVASTYLQKSVFPALEGIYYLPRNRFREHTKLIRRAEHPSYLLSRECGRYLERRLIEISSQYPDARILLFFRRHDQWIASHYRRYVKNGGTRPITGYLDLENDQGIWKQNQLVFMDMIRMVERYFGQPPLVLTYDQLQTDFEGFTRKLAGFLGASLNPDKVSMAPVHKSYSEEQLIRLRALSRKLGLADPESGSGAPRAHRLRRRLSLYRNYLLLAICKLFPIPGIVDQELAPRQDLLKVREFYAGDWQQLLTFESHQEVHPEDQAKNASQGPLSVA